MSKFMVIRAQSFICDDGKRNIISAVLPSFKEAEGSMLKFRTG